MPCRVLRLPKCLEDEDLIEVHDTWQDSARPDFLLTRRAFTHVLLPRALRAHHDLEGGGGGVSPGPLRSPGPTPCPGPNEILVR